jgi:hypothetical protein
MSAIMEEHSNWPSHVAVAQFLINSTPCATTGRSPLELLLGRQASIVIPYDGDINEGIASPVVGRILEEISTTQNIYRRVAAERMHTEIQIYADQYNLGKKLDDAAFEPGDLVLMKDHSPPQKGQVKKFTRFKWIGPLVVTSRPYPGVYMLKWRDSGKKWQSPMAQIQLKGYIEMKPRHPEQLIHLQLHQPLKQPHAQSMLQPQT